MKKCNLYWSKFTDWLDVKKIGIMLLVLFVISMIPIWYVGLFNHATGDDFWYGVHTYHAWTDTHSIIEVIKGAVLTVKEFYYSWQGTWFTIFLFALQPETFSPNGYIIVVFLSTILLIWAVSYVIYEFMVKDLQLSKGMFFITDSILLFLIFQYMPRTTSEIYWYNGIAHYVIPLFLAMMAIVHMKRYFVSKGKRNFGITFICMTALGGSSYLAALLVVMVLVLLYAMSVFPQFPITFTKRNFWMLIPFASEILGLVVSMSSPGNEIRSEEFEISIKWAVQTIYYSIDRGIYLTRDDYLGKIPVMFILLIIIGIFAWNELWKSKTSFEFPLPFLFVIYMCGIYWAMYAPSIFSKSDVSGGVPDTIQQIFLLTSIANIIYVIGWLQHVLKKRIGQDKIENHILGEKKYYTYMCIPLFILCMILIGIVGKKSTVITTDEYCIQAVVSGELQEYDTIMKEQKSILRDISIQDAVIPEIGAPYPLLHMISDISPAGQRNQELARYYRKNTVTTYMYGEKNE